MNNIGSRRPVKGSISMSKFVSMLHRIRAVWVSKRFIEDDDRTFSSRLIFSGGNAGNAGRQHRSSFELWKQLAGFLHCFHPVASNSCHTRTAYQTILLIE